MQSQLLNSDGTHRARSFKKTMALGAGAGLLLVGAMVALCLVPNTVHDTSAAELAGPTDLYQQMVSQRISSPMVSPVRTVQEKLMTYGMAPSKLQEVALTAMAAHPVCRATRDVRAAAADGLTMPEPVKVKVRDMAGISAPLGFWDPVGISTQFKDESALLFFREAEIKHGRVCMLAFLGIIVGEKYHPFFGGNVDLMAVQINEMFLKTGFKEFWVEAVILLGVTELLSSRGHFDEVPWEFENPTPSVTSQLLGNKQVDKAARIPGDLGFDPLNLKPKDPKELKEMQTKEINNGRLAMLAFWGILAQESVTHQKVFN